MKINFARLEKRLSPSGFQLASVRARGPGDCTFVRADSTPCLYQHIFVSLGRRVGAGNEVAYADVAVTPLKWHTFWGRLFERRVLKEVASNEPAPPPWMLGDWDTDIKTTADAKAWEDLLARVGPPVAAEFAAEMGPSMLERTAKAREIAARAVARLDPSAPVVCQTEELRRAMGESFAKQAEMATGAIGRIPKASDIYTLAGLAVAADGACTEMVLSAERPLQSAEIAWPVYLVADSILSWDLYETEEIRADLRFLGRK
jgi:hypothetical protein